MLAEVSVVGGKVLRLGDVALVSSGSRPGHWHRVAGGHCDCGTFLRLGHCSHLAAATTATHGLPCRRCGKLAAVLSKDGLCLVCVEADLFGDAA